MHPIAGTCVAARKDTGGATVRSGGRPAEDGRTEPHVIRGGTMHTITFTEPDRALMRKVDTAARALLALGVRRGDTVGIWAGPRHEAIVTELACARVGALLTTIEVGCQGSALGQQLRDAGAGPLMMERGALEANRIQLVVDALRDCSRLFRTIVFESDWQWFLERADEIGEAELAAA
jgi:acyl-coenzyme A synthetase/AMP-(fatty) acid ligase